MPEHNSAAAAGSVPVFATTPPPALVPPPTATATGAGNAVANFSGSGHSQAQVAGYGAGNGTFGFATASTTQGGGNTTAAKCAGPGQFANAFASPAPGASNTSTMGGPGPFVQITIHTQTLFGGGFSGTAGSVFVSIDQATTAVGTGRSNSSQATIGSGNGPIPYEQGLAAALKAAIAKLTLPSGLPTGATVTVLPNGDIVIIAPSPLAVSIPSSLGITTQVTCP